MQAYQLSNNEIDGIKVSKRWELLICLGKPNKIIEINIKKL